MGINATDNEKLANQLWGDDKYYDEDRKQFVPKDGKYDTSSDSVEEDAEKNDEDSGEGDNSSDGNNSPVSPKKTRVVVKKSDGKDQ